LKFEILGASPIPAAPWSAKAEDAGGGFTKYTGSFNTPNPTISYAAQNVQRYSGPYDRSPFYVRVDKYSRLRSDYSYNHFADVYFDIPAGLYAVENTLSTLSYAHYKIGDNAFGASSESSMPVLTLPREGSFTVYGGYFGSSAEGYKPEYGDHTILYTANTPAVQSGVYFFADSNTKVYGANETYTDTRLTFSSASDTQKIRNFSLYTIENGVKTYVTRDSLESASELAAWRIVNATAALADESRQARRRKRARSSTRRGSSSPTTSLTRTTRAIRARRASGVTRTRPSTTANTPTRP
jgi:hypothetical protein